MPFDADDIAQFCDPDMPSYAQAVIGADTVEGRLITAYHDGLGLVATRRREFTAAIDDLASVVEGASLSIGGTAYRVREVQSPAINAPHLATLVLETA